jgi:hypothetical protein
MCQKKFKKAEEFAYSLFDINSGKRSNHFCFLSYKGKFISVGENKRKTHPTNLRNPKTSRKTGEDYSSEKHICAEFDVIKKVINTTNIPLKKCELLCIRIDRNSKINYSKPCESCLSLLQVFDIKNVYYTDFDGLWKKL